MGLSGKYNFSGIKKLNAAGLKAALALSPWTAWILKGGFVSEFVLNFVGNYAANKGLVLFNLGANWANGEFDQHGFDKEMDNAWAQVENQSESPLTPEQGKAIDDGVMQAAIKFISLNGPKRKP